MMSGHQDPGNAQKAGLLSAGEFSLTRKDFDRIAAIVHAEAGISLQSNKANLVYSRLAKRLRLLGLNNFKDYCELVSNELEGEERQNMIAALTTNVTKFFREAHHFDHLKTEIIPVIRQELRQGRPVRLWSAACSSGQEPYSMALTILAAIPDAAQYDIRILATDIDPNMVAKGEAGQYEASLLTGVPPAALQRWFRPVAGQHGTHEVGDDLRALVTFRRLNLIETWPMRSKFVAIFCRNVVIYFDADTQVRLWSKMIPFLHSDGALYIGHSERVSGPAEALVRSAGITTYRPANPAKH